MKYEQTDFFGKLDGADSDKKESGDSQKVDKKIQRPNDGLDFKCEICQDAPGGCPSCGFGREQ